MMRIKKEELIQDLIIRTDQVLANAKTMESCSVVELNHQPTSGKWSALECLEHLNRYGDFYLNEISLRLNEASQTDTNTFKSGLLGNYFAKQMLPGAKSMNTFKNMNPSFSSLRPNVLSHFVEQQQGYRLLLERAKGYDLNRIKTNISISTLIKLKLGDTLRVVIYHNQRHMQQALRAIESGRNKKAAA